MCYHVLHVSSCVTCVIMCYMCYHVLHVLHALPCVTFVTMCYMFYYVLHLLPCGTCVTMCYMYYHGKLIFALLTLTNSSLSAPASLVSRSKGCKDFSNFCKRGKRSGYCELSIAYVKNFMQKYCRKSCGLCPGKVEKDGIYVYYLIDKIA